MSAPDTDTPTQEARHRPALAGIKLSLAFVAVLFLGWIGWTFLTTDGPEGAEVQVEPGVGTEPAD
ncbi:hypothetical protein [Pseudoponticoccus marisrubri]|uniref:Uncharacterized protein n=1 Tax=Pseudoponticoccus marisrubri TaxID=1685382 RepID=A0A0W7WLP8_9RHOB|nr:hypothetical protein [Pseudoponticoccus marisrubri]KUF11478.1 hypothetical protein AVJ23_06860 [Pseudoponticoccus marisrubri]